VVLLLVGFPIVTHSRYFIQCYISLAVFHAISIWHAPAAAVANCGDEKQILAGIFQVTWHFLSFWREANDSERYKIIYRRTQVYVRIRVYVYAEMQDAFQGSVSSHFYFRELSIINYWRRGQHVECINSVQYSAVVIRCRLSSSWRECIVTKRPITSGLSIAIKVDYLQRQFEEVPLLKIRLKRTSIICAT